MGAVRRQLIESGSHTPGIDPSLFGLPGHTALRYEAPTARLRPYVADYHVLDSIRPPGMQTHEIMLPGGPAVRFILEEHMFELSIGGAPPSPLPKAALYGSPSRSSLMRTGPGGVTIGATLTAAGLARLGIDAFALRDTVVPLGSVLDPAFVAGLHAALSGSDRGPAVKAILDAALLPLFDRPHPHDEAIRRIAAVVATPGITSVEQAREMCAMSKRQLERLAKRYFGFSPKLMLRRTRLLRSIVALKMAHDPEDMSAIDSDYFDHSHFTRDAHRFLGMAPLQFLRQASPYRDAALRARTMVLGAALAVLDPVPVD